MQRIVVVGASLAGLRAAEAVRAAGFTGEVVVIGDEPWMPYNRPPLSKEALAGGISPDALELRRRRSVADVGWLLGTAATAADLDARTVTLADGTVHGWDGLVIATGLRPRRLDLPGPSGGRYVLRTLDDALALRAALVPGARVVVIGAGFLGCEIAASATGLGCPVAVVAPEEQPMLRPLGPLVGAALGRRHTAHGVDLRLGRLPVAFAPASVDPGRVGAVLLDDGTRLPADVVVEALGCRPNVEWLAGTGLDLSDGVLTDSLLRAVDRDGAPRPTVVAVGDVARFPDALAGGPPRRIEHWNVPVETARRAGPALVAVLSGADPTPEPFVLMPSFWSDQFGRQLQSFGSPGPTDEVTVLAGDLDDEFVAGYVRDGRLVGVVGIGMMPRLLALRADLLAAAGT